jgi:hypothetical protein
LAATLSLPAAAQEYSNGGKCKKGRKEATLTPVEAFGVHPPGPDPADAHRRVFCWWRRTYVPYYAAVAPVATSVRWKPWCYFPLMPYYTPYYIGYCPKRLHNPKPAPYGSDGWGQGPMPGQDGHDPSSPLPNYGLYTSIIQDDTIFWNMGGNGLVPYGTPRPPHLGPLDLVDAIQTSWPTGGVGPQAPCIAPPDGAPVAAVNDGTATEILPPSGKSAERKGSPQDMNNK